MKRIPVILSAAAVLLSGCHKTPVETPENKQFYYANYFAYNMMNAYYLWVEEISEGMASWGYYDNPIEKVREIRYKDANGQDIDHWSMVTDDFSSFSGSVSGNTKSYGFDFSLYYTDESQKRIEADVRFVYAGSPAAEAGLDRGDVILTVNGKTMTPDNYYGIVVNELLGGDHVQLGLEDKRTVDLTARNMYEEPVHTSRVFDAGGWKIGYLHYTSFTLDSCRKLLETLRSFKQQGVEELILDLRYNGGGFVKTELMLASMLAPEQDVRNGSVFSTEVYNKYVTGEMKDPASRFSLTHSIPGDDQVIDYDISDALLAPKKIYALVTGDSASASESLLCCLKPYVDITLIGEQTSGKYCSGMMLSANDWYDAVKDQLDAKTYQEGLEYADNWGIYVMYARYADKNGVTLCMPDGLVPDVRLRDNPRDGAKLGDPQETMLAKALSLAGVAVPQAEDEVPALDRVPGGPERNRGRIFTAPALPQRSRQVLSPL